MTPSSGADDPRKRLAEKKPCLGHSAKTQAEALFSRFAIDYRSTMPG